MISTKLDSEKRIEARLYEVMYVFAGAGAGIRALESTKTVSDDMKRFSEFLGKNQHMPLGNTPEEFAFMNPLIDDIEARYQALRKNVFEVGFDPASRADYTKETFNTLTKHVSIILKELGAVEFAMQEGHLMEPMDVLLSAIRG